MNTKEAKALVLKLQPDQIAGLSNVELCELSTAASVDLRKHFQTRRSRDKAMNLCTVLFLLDAEIAKRLGVVDFCDPIRHEDEEESEQRDAWERDGGELGGGVHVGMQELLSGFDESAVSFRDWSEAQKRDAREGRLSALQDLLDYFFKDTSSVEQVVTKLLAVTRRLRPQALEKFGLSQVAVGRRLGVGRATVSAREKRLVERPLRAAGARGLISNGARGAATSAACARAAEGNSNRAGKLARRAAV